MEWAVVAVLGFALEIALVIAMARSNTARWERDHRAARAAIRAREEAGLRVRAAALMAQGVRHPHLTHLPHVHLPPRVVDRLAHTRGTLHRPHLHLHLPYLSRHRSRPEVLAPAEEVLAPAPEVPGPAPEVPAPATAPDDATTAGAPSSEQSTP